MARPIRVQFEGAYYHLTARGNERREIFKSDHDRELFLKTLEEMLQMFGVLLHCYCLMPNHYHLVVQTPRANLSRAMAWFQSTYTNRYNKRHKRSGHLYQGRYKAHLVEVDEYAIQLIRYIHLNPVRGRAKNHAIAREKKAQLETYLWSSHRYYSGKAKAPEWLELDWLSYYDRTRRKAHKAYRKDIDESFEKGAPNPLENSRGGFVLGTEPFWEKVWELMDGKRARHDVRWKEYHGRKRIEDQIRRLVEKQSDERIQMWLRVRLGGERLVDVARQLGYRDGAGVCHVVTRLEKQASQDTALSRKLKELRGNLSIVMR